MNELRRKIVLSTPLMTAGLLVGCGGGGSADPLTAAPADGRVQAQAIAKATGQSLLVAAVGNAALDSIWGDAYGGAYIAPNSLSPLIQTVVNGTALIVTLTEQITLTTGKAIRSLTLTLDNGAAPALQSSYATSTTPPGFIPTVKSAVLRVLVRQSAGDTRYCYGLNTNNNATVNVTSVGAATNVSYDGGRSLSAVRAFALDFTMLKLDAASGTSAANGIMLSGTTTLNVLPAETIAWL